MAKSIQNIIVIFLCTSFGFGNFNSLDDIKKYIEPLKKYFKSNDKSDESDKSYENRPIEIRLNINPNRIDAREWIPYIDGYEISQEQFWKLMEDPNLESYWRDKEQKKKAALKDRFDFKKIILAGCTTYIGLFWHKKVEIDDETNIGNNNVIQTRNGYVYTESPKPLVYGLSNLFIAYEFSNGIYGLFQRTFGKSFPLKNQISHYQIKYQVENYNRLKINTKISE